jgi:hypothetical protein
VKIELSSMNVMEWVVWLALLTTILVGIGGLITNGWSFTTGLFWRIASFALPVFPVCLGAVTLLVCRLARYDNGSMDAFHPDSFMCGCLFIGTPVFIVVGFLFSLFAKGIRWAASATNIGLGVLWWLVMTHIKM